MRGIGRVMPWTKWCFLAGALALVGIPPFAGFFSKDPIIASTLNIGWYGYVFYACGLVGAFLTGLYTFRLWFLVFPGEPSPFVREHYHDHHGREGAWTMLVPVGVLAVLATVGGWIQFPPHWDPITKWLAPVAPSLPNAVASSTQETVTSIVTVLVGLAGIAVAWAIYSERKLAIPAVPAVRRVLEHKLYFDEAYDRIFYAPAAWLAAALLREFEEPVVLADRHRRRRDDARRRGPRPPAPDRAAPHVCPAPRRGSGRRRPRLPDCQVNASYLTSILIWLPVAGAIVIWVLPLSRYATGALALLISFAEVGFWIKQAAHFDFSQPGLQMSERANWFGDLGVSYHVGVYGFSLWLVGLTVVGMAACTAYGFWVGRDRPRAYFGLMLLLTGATVGVFEAQDLLLFYAFFEAMLIPLYILIGVWGGARRMEATVKFVLYTMAGSLLMLAAIIVYGLQAGTFDLVDGPTSGSRWLFLGFMVAFVIKAPLFPFHGWLPDAYRQAPPEVAAILSGVIAKAGLYGMLRIAITKFPDPTGFYRTTVLALAAAALVYGSLLAFRAPDFRGVVAYSSLAQSGLITLGLFAGTDLGYDGAVLQMVAHGLISISLFLVAGAVERRTTTGEFRLLGGMARGRPALATLLMTVGVISLAVPGSASFAGEFLILAGVFQRAWWWAAIGAGAIVLAAMYMLRVISAVLHEARGSTVSDSALDLRPGELALVVPLVAGLLFLSAWPAAISGHSFFGPSPTAAVKSGFK